MKRDKIEKILHDHLHDHRIEPAAGLYGRIEKSFAASKNKSAASMPRRSPGSAWRYVAAASIMLLIAGGGYLLVQKQNRMLHVMNDSKIAAIPETPSSGALKPFRAESTPIVNAGDVRSKAGRSATHTSTIEYAIEGPSSITQEQLPTNKIEGEKASQDMLEKRPYIDRSVKQNTRTMKYSASSGTPPSRRSSSRARSQSTTISVYAVNTGVLSDGKSSSPTTAPSSIYSHVGFLSDAQINLGAQNDLEISNVKHRVPITLGVGFSWNLSKSWSFESGVNYTLLRSQWDATKISTSSVTQDLQYLGIPINLSFRFFGAGKWGVYARGGGVVERGIAGTSKRSTYMNSRLVSEEKGRIDMGNAWQFSLGTAIGIDLAISNHINLYAEPGISYYFKNSGQPSSYYTEYPVGFNLRAGIRFNLSRN